jgi:hypothetical protein
MHVDHQTKCFTARVVGTETHMVQELPVRGVATHVPWSLHVPAVHCVSPPGLDSLGFKNGNIHSLQLQGGCTLCKSVPQLGAEFMAQAKSMCSAAASYVEGIFKALPKLLEAP